MHSKPFGFSEQIVRMKHKADKFELRLRLVRFALQEGVKPAARTFQTTPKTVRKWLDRYRQDRTRDGFGPTVEGFGAAHKRIPNRAWSYNSDVETVHRTIEEEFFNLETFASIRDFHQRVASYQAWYNLVRTNMNKQHKTPWQVVHQTDPKIPIQLVRLPPIMLDWLGPDYMTKEEYALRGYDLPWLP